MAVTSGLAMGVVLCVWFFGADYCPGKPCATDVPEGVSGFFGYDGASSLSRSESPPDPLQLYDLRAQESMARAANVAILVGLLGMFVSSVSLILLWLTFAETRRSVALAADEAELNRISTSASVAAAEAARDGILLSHRPFLNVYATGIVSRRIEEVFDDDSTRKKSFILQLVLVAKNIGRNPFVFSGLSVKLNVSGKWSYLAEYGYELVDSPTTIRTIGTVVDQGEELEITKGTSFDALLLPIGYDFSHRVDFMMAPPHFMGEIFYEDMIGNKYRLKFRCTPNSPTFRDYRTDIDVSERRGTLVSRST